MSIELLKRVPPYMLTMGIATLIFALYIGPVQINATSHSLFLEILEAAFAVFAILSFGGIFASCPGVGYADGFGIGRSVILSPSAISLAGNASRFGVSLHFTL